MVLPPANLFLCLLQGLSLIACPSDTSSAAAATATLQNGSMTQLNDCGTDDQGLVDKLPTCYQNVDICFDPAYTDYMVENCPKTCRKCDSLANSMNQAIPTTTRPTATIPCSTPPCQNGASDAAITPPRTTPPTPCITPPCPTGASDATIAPLRTTTTIQGNACSSPSCQNGTSNAATTTIRTPVTTQQNTCSTPPCPIGASDATVTPTRTNGTAQGNVCGTQPCQNGASCIPGADGGYRCNCSENFRGTNCEVVLQCTATSCPANTDCFVQNQQLNCVAKPGFSADKNGGYTTKMRLACMTGDPHYTTFDGLKFDYQGTCPYVLTQPCGYDINPYFSIRAQNRQWYNYRVSTIAWVELNINGSIFKVDENFTLTVDGARAAVPYTYFLSNDPNWKVKASVSAGQMRITTPENLEIIFYPSVLCVNVPEEMVKGTGRLCGLFGDVDNDCKNDLRGVKKNLIGVPPDNCQIPADGVNGMLGEKFGDDWIDDFQGGKCLPGTVFKSPSLPCAPADFIAAQQTCQAIEQAKSGRGIFAKCAGMGAQLDEMLNTCAYDICADKNLRCKTLTNFVQACQQAIPGTRLTGWRENTTCPLTCPANQYYSDCVSGCQTSCANTTGQAVCNRPCLEGCTCNDGTVLDGSGMQCVPQQDCGCADERGNYFQTGSTWMNNDCSKAYMCMGNGKLIVKDVACGSRATCSVVNREYQCNCLTGTGTCKTAAQTINDPTTNLLCNCGTGLLQWQWNRS